LRLSRSHVVFVHDIVMAAVAFAVSIHLRLGWPLPADYGPERLLGWGAAFVTVAAVCYRTQGLYRGVWRYASLNDLGALLRAVTLAVVAFVLLLFLVDRGAQLPRSVPLINWFVLIVLLGGPRFVYRLFKDHRLMARSAGEVGDRVPVLLVGAGDEADAFLRGLRSGDSPYSCVGLLSEHGRRLGQDIQGHPVHGLIDDADRVIDALAAAGRGPRRLVLTHDRIGRDRVARLLEVAESRGLSLARLPRRTELRDGVEEDGRIDVRPVDLGDLLGRPQRVLDRAAVARHVTGRRVLVTGAGGSIGSELVRQIAALDPSCLVLLDASEYALYTIDLELAESRPGLRRVAVLADVRDRGRIAAVMAEHRPELVFHAAALKHVPLVESNPVEGLRTNALGTRVVAEACRDHGVAAMVLVSTDKAVHPTSVMGASKRVAERICQALDVDRRAAPGGEGGGTTRHITVRFGNVLGSAGSVVPLFRRQLARGGPLTVTHPEMSRYFMTIREAAELILQAAAHGVEHEALRGHIFVLDMGRPLRIVDLARQMIRLAGRTPDSDVKIVFTGLRPGENLHEEVFHDGEGPNHAIFEVTDGGGVVVVNYVGDEPLPPLFGEGEGMVGTGRLIGGTFVATEVLARHDEEYMPREVVDALKEQGMWNHEEGGPNASAKDVDASY